jgi:hypothetical protein
MKVANPPAEHPVRKAWRLEIAYQHHAICTVVKFFTGQRESNGYITSIHKVLNCIQSFCKHATRYDVLPPSLNIRCYYIQFTHVLDLWHLILRGRWSIKKTGQNIQITLQQFTNSYKNWTDPVVTHKSKARLLSLTCSGSLLFIYRCHKSLLIVFSWNIYAPFK